MQKRKIGILILALFTTSFAFGQSEALKVVVNNLAFYKQKGDLKFLSNAKKSADSLVVTTERFCRSGEECLPHYCKQQHFIYRFIKQA
jgi:predicted ThiF/HesA family dinucleotide-utilizing enzyme